MYINHNNKFVLKNTVKAFVEILADENICLQLIDLRKYIAQNAHNELEI